MTDATGCLMKRCTVGWELGMQVGDFGLIQGQLEDFTLYIKGLGDRAPADMVPHKSLNAESQRLDEAPTGDPNLCSPMLIQPRRELGHEVSSSRVPAAAVLLESFHWLYSSYHPSPNNRNAEDCDGISINTLALGGCRWQKEPYSGPTSPRALLLLQCQEETEV